MALNLVTKINAEYLYVTVTGEWRLADTLGLIGRVKEEADQATLRRILVNIQSVRGAAPSWSDKSAVGRAVADTLSDYRLVVLSHPELRDYDTEIVANNRGASMAAKRSEEEALRWLLE